MSEPRLPAPVALRHHSNDSTNPSPTLSRATLQQLEHLASGGNSAAVPSPGATAPLSDDNDAPYVYPAMHPPKFPVGSYLAYVKRVAANSPILQPVFRPCLNPDKLDVVILDIKDDWTCSQPYIFGESKSIDEYFGPDPVVPRGKKLGYSSLRAFLDQPRPADVAVRLFLAEDLSPATIEALGSTLNLDPNFFAEQLVGTRYTLEGHEDLVEIRDTLPTMPFLLKPKTFFSATWKRSALHHAWADGPPREPPKGRFMAPARSSIGSVKDGSAAGHQYNNMHRLFDAIGEHVLSRESKIAVAAEERISFLRKDNDDHSWTGVFLFDPVRETPGNRYNVLYNYNYRNIQPTPSYQEFDGSNYAPEPANDPRTRNQFIKYITRIKEIKDNQSGTGCDDIDISSSSSFLNLLFHFMLNDWNSVLREMDKFLDEVDTLMSDNNTLQKKLVTWRIILGSWRKNLVDDSEKIRTTLGIIEQHGLDNFKPAFQEMLGHVESLKDRTERTFGALMSSMAIVESQRAISQAESISRLTELAFFFIPLSFATSLFGMQLPGWSENYRPYQWIVLSTCLVTGSYGFRIVVRSRVVQYAIENIPEHVREDTTIPPGAHIPTYEYLTWFIKRSWKSILVIAVSATSLALIWKLGRSMTVKIGTTVMVCLILGSGLAAIFYMSHRRRKNMHYQDWFRRQDEKRQIREGTRQGHKIV